MQGLFVKYSASQFILTDDFYRVENNSLHFLAKLLQNKTAEERVLFRLLGKVILQAEAISGGSAVPGFLFSYFFLQKLLQVENNLQDTFIEKVFIDNCTQLKRNIENNMSICTKKDISDFISTICTDKVFSKVLMASLETAGLEGKIYLEDGKQFDYIVEKTQGYNFTITPHKLFIPNGSLDLVDVKVLLCDGVVERVSEIDRILVRAFDTKEPVMFVAKGFGDEVISTLKVNYDKKNFNIIPVVVNENLESINILSDIASVCGADIVSAMKGEMLSFVNLDEIKSVKKVKFGLGQITIEETSTKARVSNHLQNLLSKRIDNQNIFDIADILDKRIKCLTSNTTTIRLPLLDELTAQTFHAQTDICLRGTKSLLNNGVVSLKDVSNSFVVQDDNFVSMAFKSALADVAKIFPGKLSTLSAYLGIYLLSKQMLMIYMAKGCVLADGD